VQAVTANPTTGNVLILYDSEKVSQFDIFDILLKLGFLKKQSLIYNERDRVSLIQAMFSEKLTDVVISSVAELAIKGIIKALI
jgi:hypothetical protein